VLALIGQTGWRGELVLLDGEAERSIYFESGSAVGARSNVPEERVGQILYRYGVVEESALESIHAACTGGRRFGEAAVELGLATREQVYSCLGRQIEEIVYASLTISDGMFFFLDGFDASALVSRHTLSVHNLLMEAVTRMDELRFFSEKIPSGECIPVRIEGRAEPGKDFLDVYQVIDGNRTVDEIGRVTGRGEFATTRQLYALVQSGHVAIHPPHVSGGPQAIVEMANIALRATFRLVEAQGQGDVVRRNLASFAEGAGVYDMLFRGAGPDQTGVLDAPRVAENSLLVASGSDPENLLKQMLHEYVSFALFSAGGAIGSEAEGQLKREVMEVLTALRPSA
jgi:hypothetical protein